MMTTVTGFERGRQVAEVKSQIHLGHLVSNYVVGRSVETIQGPQNTCMEGREEKRMMFLIDR